MTRVMANLMRPRGPLELLALMITCQAMARTSARGPSTPGCCASGSAAPTASSSRPSRCHCRPAVPDHLALADFRARHFDYGAGHHVAFFGPTQIAGKSTLSFALQESVIARYPEIQPVGLCMKHRDRVVAHWTRRLGYRETPVWPPPPRLSELPPFGTKPAGYTLWPRQSLSVVDADYGLLEAQFKRAITHIRGHVPSITNANELYGMLAELNLRKLLTAVVTRDSVMPATDCGMSRRSRPAPRAYRFRDFSLIPPSTCSFPRTARREIGSATGKLPAELTRARSSARRSPLTRSPGSTSAGQDPSGP